LIAASLVIGKNVGVEGTATPSDHSPDVLKGLKAPFRLTARGSRQTCESLPVCSASNETRS